MKNQEFCLMSKPEEVRNHSLLAISEECEPPKMKTAGKRTVFRQRHTFGTKVSDRKSLLKRLPRQKLPWFIIADVQHTHAWFPKAQATSNENNCIFET
jgi:hypothetical protein